MPANYPPYVNAYGSIGTLLSKIKEAAVPAKFTRDFLGTVLDLKSSSYHAMIPLLKRLGFLDGSNVPTQSYKEFRDDSSSGRTLAKLLRHAYRDLYSANEYAHKLKKDEIASKVRTLLGVGTDDEIVPSVAGTFTELCKFADFAAEGAPKPPSESPTTAEPPKPNFERHQAHSTKLGISYTINLNLPATTEIEVFNAIFKSLKEHILSQD
jgi:hypothetical protein